MSTSRRTTKDVLVDVASEHDEESQELMTQRIQIRGIEEETYNDNTLYDNDKKIRKFHIYNLCTKKVGYFSFTFAICILFAFIAIEFKFPYQDNEIYWNWRVIDTTDTHFPRDFLWYVKQ